MPKTLRCSPCMSTVIIRDCSTPTILPVKDGWHKGEDPNLQSLKPLKPLILGSGFRVQGLGFRVQGSGFGDHGLGFKVYSKERTIKAV